MQALSEDRKIEGKYYLFKDKYPLLEHECGM
jgi:hypothetical protein